MLQNEGRVQAPWVLKKIYNAYERSEVRASGFPRHATSHSPHIINMSVMQALFSGAKYMNELIALADPNGKEDTMPRVARAVNLCKKSGISPFRGSNAWKK